MNLKIAAAVALLPVLVACGGGGGDGSGDNGGVDPDRGNTGGGGTDTTLDEDRTRPAAGTYSTSTTPIKIAPVLMEACFGTPITTLMHKQPPIAHIQRRMRGMAVMVEAPPTNTTTQRDCCIITS